MPHIWQCPLPWKTLSIEDSRCNTLTLCDCHNEVHECTLYLYMSVLLEFLCVLLTGPKWEAKPITKAAAFA